MHKDTYKESRAQRDLRRSPKLPSPDQAGTIADPITSDGIIRSQSERLTDKVRKAKRHCGDMVLAEGDLNTDLGEDRADAPENSLIFIDDDSDSRHSSKSVSRGEGIDADINKKLTRVLAVLGLSQQSSRR